jgi:leucyl-tRNA synthetase
VNTKCPKCGGPAKRETNTMPQWAGSCWYYLRYIDPKNSSVFCAREKEKYWTPVDLYVGGAEHAVLHLLYSRFWHKVLFDLGHVSTPEPFMKLRNQGMILGEDNQKMSKSRGGSNVINPDDIVREYGADALRMYEMFMGPLEATKPWSMSGVEGVYRFLGRVWRLFIDEASDRQYQQDIAAGTRKSDDLSILKISAAIQDNSQAGTPVPPEQWKLLHATIKKVTQDLDEMLFNTAISGMMVFVNEAMKISVAGQPLAKSVMEQFVLLLSPFAPHLAEELWRMFGHSQSLAYEPWPVFDEKYLVEDTIEIVVQVNGKLRDKITVPSNASEEQIKTLAQAGEKVKAAIEGKSIKKVIVIPKKLVNIVVG